MAVRRTYNKPFLPPIVKGKRGKSNRFSSIPEKPQADLSDLSEQELFRRTKSLQQVISVEMLQDGFHRSFEMFFRVLDLDQERRDTICPTLADTLPPPLEQQPEKLHMMRKRLTSSEHAERSGSWSVVCEQYLSLALFFSSPKDLWLRLHFLHVCADREQGHSSRAATEAMVQLAEIYLEQGDLEEALQYAESGLSQADEGSWLDSSGFPLKTRAQYALCGIFTRLADDPLKYKNYIKATALLHQALNNATDSGNKKIEGEATYRMGVAYQLTGDHSTAKKYLNTYIKICQELDNASGVGKAYRAMAKSLESEGNTEEMVRSLQMLTDPLTIILPCDQVEACLSLGTYYFNKSKKLASWTDFLPFQENVIMFFLNCNVVVSLGKTLHPPGDLDQACEYYSRGHEGAETLGYDLQMKANMLLGRARAQSMMGQFASLILSSQTSRSSLQTLITWKDSREWPESVNQDENSTVAPTEGQHKENKTVM